jgi:hypothetical protein
VYRTDRHGGNVGLRELAADAAGYDVNILEVAASNANTEEIYERESLWKTKLGTRAVGSTGTDSGAAGGGYSQHR